jgi:glycosyltransferase involved in cell wall biosynthesis
MTTSNNNKLAIVMPAYKGRFLRQALDSIATQTDKRFTVYIGNDASPDNIKGICDDFTDRLNLVYTRFDENLGQSSLVAHWNRCIELSKEPWIWLFCDDDIMEPQCVEMFYKTIGREKDKFKVLRFNTLTIDDHSKVTRVNPLHPETESGIRFIYHRLKGERASFVTEYIFARETYLKDGGMVEFPLAWASDDASWLTFSKEHGIATIQGANVLWRHGAYNISPPGPKYQTMRIEAAFRFVNWLDNFIKINGVNDQLITREIIKELSRDWFLRQIQCVTPITWSNFVKFACFVQSITEKGWIYSYILLLSINCKNHLRRLRRTRN